MSSTTMKRKGSQGAAAPVPCWSCHGPVGAGDLFCPACKSVQRPGAADHFQRLGLARDFALDEAKLDRRYFALQRQLHPDRFVTKSARERAISQAQATSLNEAYETLREPLSRAVYLLRAMGVEIEPGDGATISDSALLMEAMEMREALADALDASGIAAIEARVEREKRKTLAALADAFAGGNRDAARAATLRMIYLARLGDEIRTRRAALRAKAGVP